VANRAWSKVVLAQRVRLQLSQPVEALHLLRCLLDADPIRVAQTTGQSGAHSEHGGGSGGVGGSCVGGVGVGSGAAAKLAVGAAADTAAVALGAAARAATMPHSEGRVEAPPPTAACTHRRIPPLLPPLLRSHPRPALPV